MSSTLAHLMADTLPLHYVDRDGMHMHLAATTVAECPDCPTGLRRWNGSVFTCTEECGAGALGVDDILTEWDERPFIGDSGHLIIATYAGEC